MTEAEWLACEDTKPMLRYLIGTDSQSVFQATSFPDARGSGRKLRLFACACYYRVDHLLPHPAARAAVEATERFADGEVSREDFDHLRDEVRPLAALANRRWRERNGREVSPLYPEPPASLLAAVELVSESELDVLQLAAFVCDEQPPRAAWIASFNACSHGSKLANPGVGPVDPARRAGEVAERQAHCR